MSRLYLAARYVATRCAVAATAACAMAALGVVPASAVQTATFGLAASGSRTKIVHPAQESPIHDSVVVYNRTAKPVTITLDVVGVTRQAGGSYSLGASGTGLATGVRLDRRLVALAGKARQVVGVTIDSPKDLKKPAYAAVTAVAGLGASRGVAVTERLAVLVGVTPPDGDVSATAHTSGATHKRTVAVVVATVLLLALLAVLIAALVLRRRRRPAADGPQIGHP